MAWYKYFSVEVPFLLTSFAMILQGAIVTNLYVYRTCYVLLGYNKSDCAQLGNEDNNITALLEPKVQPTVNHINMVHSVINNLIPLIFCMFVGTWSDRFGRKPFILFCTAGITLSTAASTLIIHFEDVSPWWFIASALPGLLTGGLSTFMMVSTAYITDVTDEKDRLIRLGVMEVLFGLSSVLGNLVSSHLFYATSYQTIFLIATSLNGFSFLYTLFIPESLKGGKQKLNFTELVKSINLMDIFDNFTKIRTNNARPYIFAIIGTQMLFGVTMGGMQVESLFLRAKFHWTLSKLTTIGSITSFGNIMGTVIGTSILYRMLKIKELPLCFFGTVLLSVSNILRAIATNNYYIYAAYACGIFFGLPGLMLRTVLSFMVAPEEMGKIFAVTSIIMNIDLLIGNLIYPLIYNATLDTNSGLFNYFSFGIHAIVATAVLFMTRVKFPYHEHTTIEGEEAEKSKKPSITINNFSALGINERRSFRPSLEIDTRAFTQSPIV